MIRRALALAALGAAFFTASASSDDYLATSGSVFTSLRPTGVGLPQIGASGTVGAGDLPSALRTYHDGGQYDKDLAAVAGAAQDYLDARLNGDATDDPAAPGSSSGGGSGGGSAGTQGGATGGGSSTPSRRTTAAGTKCTTKYLRVKRAKGRSALYKRKVTCPKARKKSSTVKRSAAAKPAIVLDIDETSLSNYSGLAASNFSSAGTAIPAAAGTGTAIAPTLALYKDARARGVAVFFVTGRPSLIDAATQSNLRSVGYNQGTEAFKSGARAAIQAKGYDIVLNMGDQESDLDGGHADRDFKLPNPYYFISD
jgi:hypothetical protein